MKSAVGRCIIIEQFGRKASCEGKFALHALQSIYAQEIQSPG
jgi:hypothetical protein